MADSVACAKSSANSQMQSQHEALTVVVPDVPNKMTMVEP